MAMLEAFVYDPLISWRLLTEAEAKGVPEADGVPVGESVAGPSNPAGVESTVEAGDTSFAGGASSLVKGMDGLETEPMRGDGEPSNGAHPGAMGIRRPDGVIPSAEVHVRMGAAGLESVRSMAESAQNMAHVPRSVREKAIRESAEVQEMAGSITARQNEEAVRVMQRITSKLTGKEFGADVLPVPEQVDRLILQARSHENLCQGYFGWCPFW